MSSHVLPALIRKAHEAKARGDATLSVWGTGSPLREFLHVDDCADACVHLMTAYSGDQHVNIGSGKEISILDVTKLICEVVGFQGEIVCDPSKPDGTPRKLMSIDKIAAMGWKPRIDLREGLALTYQYFIENHT